MLSTAGTASAEDPVQRADHPASPVRVLRAARSPTSRSVKNAAGMTVNDVVMALSTGALRRWLEDHDALPDSPLVAAVPISVRTDEEAGTAGNRISGMIAALPTQLASPLDRLQTVHEAMRVAKEQHGALPADLLSGRHPVRHPGAGRSGGAAQRAAPAAGAGQPVQPLRLQRARAQRPAVFRAAPSCWRTTRSAPSPMVRGSTSRSSAIGIRCSSA